MKLVRLPEHGIKLRSLAEMWGCSARFLREQVKNGELQGVRLGRDWCVPVSSANDFFERRRVRT